MILVSRLGDPGQTLYLVDISSFIFRAFFGIRALRSRSGEPTNAVYGVATMLAKLIEEAKAERLVVVYDSKEPSFREKIYPEYKANRSAPPEDLVPQFARVDELIEALGIQSYRQGGVEADDLIATLTKKWCQASSAHHVVIVSSDKDLMQLVDDRVQVWDTMSNKVSGPAEVEEKFGVKPAQIRDYLALVGDSSDNIPGVPGVGPKTAAELLRQFTDLERILSAASAGEIAGKKGEAIRTNEKNARLSAELATLDERLELELDVESCRYRFHVTSKCAELLKALDFHSLLKRWTEAAPATAVPVTGVPESTAHVVEVSSDQTKTFRTVNTERDLTELLNAIERRGEFGFDLETTSLNPRQAELVGVAICYDPAFGAYVPVGHRGTSIEQLPLGRVLDAFKPFLENPRIKKIGQNLKYDWSVLYQLGIKPSGIGADTMVAAYVLSPEGRHNLEKLASQYLDHQVMTYEQVCGKGPDQIGFDLVPVDLATRYSAEDAVVAVRLWEKLRERLQAERLMEVFARVDLPLVDVLARMECEGVSIDVPWLQSLSSEFARELSSIEGRVMAYSRAPLNLNSTRQLAHLLFDELKLPVQTRTKTGFSTDASVLEALAPLHEVPRLLLEYREIAKLKGTYVDPLPQLRDQKTGKIHASFHQTVTTTGRLSSSDPNLQNIPIRSERGKKIRRAFIPSEGNVLFAADYSQIELRLLAHMSSDPELTRSFLADEDVHRRTASEIFGVSPDRVDDRQRGIAKAVNFGLMYGKTAFGLSQELKISRKEAQAVIDRYFQRYSGVKRFLDQLIVDAREHGCSSTLLGRKRRFADLGSANHAVKANAERMAMNAPIQGTAADLMKLAMIEIDERLRVEGCRSKLIIQVHDEVVLDCPKDEVEAVQKLVVEAMESAMKLDVPLRVNSASGSNWMEL